MWERSLLSLLAIEFKVNATHPLSASRFYDHASKLRWLIQVKISIKTFNEDEKLAVSKDYCGRIALWHSNTQI